MTEEVINPGQDVIGRDGEKLGTVAYIVVDPNGLHITDLVVSTGAILGRDVVVPEDAVDRVEGGKVYLNLDKDELNTHKDYVEVEYEAPSANWVPTAGFGYPTGSMLWPAGVYYPTSTSVKVNAPPGTVGLHHGMDVYSRDGEKVGSIDAVVADPSSEDVTEIVVKHGFIFTTDAAIPAAHVQTIEPDRVNLDLTKDQVEQQYGSR